MWTVSVVVTVVVLLLGLTTPTVDSYRVQPRLSMVGRTMHVKVLSPSSSSPRTASLALPIAKPSTALSSHHLSHAAAGSDSTAIINRAALKAIGKLLSTCGIGVWAGKVGILDQAALSVLSKLIFNIFQPCLLFVNVARTVANLSGSAAKSGSAEAIYMLPIAAALQVVVGYVVGKLLSFFIYRNDPDNDEAKELMACTTFANSGPLPLVFTEGLFHTSADHTLVGRSAAYISLYLLGWSPLFWILGPAILQQRNGQHKKDPAQARKELLSRIFSPPVVASLLGMAVGFVPFLRNLVVHADSPLSVVYEAMRTLGSAYLPSVLMVLAGSLSPPAAPAAATATAAPAAATAAPAATATATEKKVDWQFVMKVGSVYLSRFLLMPAIGFGALKFLAKTSPAMATLFAKDRLLLFVLLLETCMPSAQNTTVILQLQGNKAGATKLARTLMMIYVLGVPAITFWLVQILQLTKLASA
eukprot:gene4765-3420_t